MAASGGQIGRTSEKRPTERSEFGKMRSTTPAIIELAVGRSEIGVTGSVMQRVG